MATNDPTAGVTVRLTPNLRSGLDQWIASRAPPRPAVGQAIELILSSWLAARGYLPDGSMVRHPDRKTHSTTSSYERKSRARL